MTIKLLKFTTGALVASAALFFLQGCKCFDWGCKDDNACYQTCPRPCPKPCAKPCPKPCPPAKPCRAPTNDDCCHNVGYPGYMNGGMYNQPMQYQEQRQDHFLGNRMRMGKK